MRRTLTEQEYRAAKMRFVREYYVIIYLAINLPERFHWEYLIQTFRKQFKPAPQLTDDKIILGLTNYYKKNQMSKEIKSAKSVLHSHTREHYALNSNIFAAENDILKAMEEYKQQFQVPVSDGNNR